MTKRVPVTTYVRSGPDVEWVEAQDGGLRAILPHVAGAIGYKLYIEPGLPLIERPTTGNRDWRIRPVAGKPLIHKGRKP